MNPKLTNRDVSLLLDVYKFRYLSVTQLARLHFPSRRMAYRRLQALTTLKCLKAFSPPNIPERIFYLDREGAEIVAGELRVTVSDLQWYRYAKTPKDYFFIKHFLAINDFRILLTHACRISPMRLLGFISGILSAILQTTPCNTPILRTLSLLSKRTGTPRSFLLRLTGGQRL
jgi:Replication-relaxation